MVSSTIDDLVKHYAGKLRVVSKNFLIHEPVRLAHQAACAAGMQGKFAAFKDAWWKQAFGKGTYDQAAIDSVAKSAGLDLAKLHADEQGATCKQLVDQDTRQLEEVFHVEGTPTFFINGTPFEERPTEQALEQVIDAKLAEAEKSGVPCASYYQQVVMAKGLQQFRSAAAADGAKK